MESEAGGGERATREGPVTTAYGPPPAGQGTEEARAPRAPRRPAFGVVPPVSWPCSPPTPLHTLHTHSIHVHTHSIHVHTHHTYPTHITSNMHTT